jgi:FKBP12-rapamycin complex-associated protein
VAVASLQEVRVEVWLEVVPQLIARIDHPSALVKSALQGLLLRVAKAHPQALIYPMAVASNTTSGSSARADAAAQIIHATAVTNRRLVDEATMVRELYEVPFPNIRNILNLLSSLISTFVPIFLPNPTSKR